MPLNYLSTQLHLVGEFVHDASVASSSALMASAVGVMLSNRATQAGEKRTRRWAVALVVD